MGYKGYSPINHPFMAGLEFCFAFSKAADCEALGKLASEAEPSPNVNPASFSATLAALLAAFSKAVLTAADTIPKNKLDPQWLRETPFTLFNYGFTDLTQDTASLITFSRIPVLHSVFLW